MLRGHGMGIRFRQPAGIRRTDRCPAFSELRCETGRLRVVAVELALTASPPRQAPNLGYARVSTEHQSLDQQPDALAAAGVEESRVYSDQLSGTSTRQERPGLAALLDYAREGDAIVVVGIDRLGRNAVEVMTTIRELGARGGVPATNPAAVILRTR
jgi:predicted site-specific integrase-resolvase